MKISSDFTQRTKRNRPFTLHFFEPMNPNTFWFDFGPFEQRFSKLIWGFYLASPFDQKPKDLVEFDVVKKEKSNLNDAICSYKNHCFFVSESAQIEQGSYKIALWVLFHTIDRSKTLLFRPIWCCVEGESTGWRSRVERYPFCNPDLWFMGSLLMPTCRD